MQICVAWNINMNTQSSSTLHTVHSWQAYCDSTMDVIMLVQFLITVFVYIIYSSSTIVQYTSSFLFLFHHISILLLTLQSWSSPTEVFRYPLPLHPSCSIRTPRSPHQLHQELCLVDIRYQYIICYKEALYISIRYNIKGIVHILIKPSQEVLETTPFLFMTHVSCTTTTQHH